MSVVARAFRRIANAIRPNVEIRKMPPGVPADWNVPLKVRDGTILRVNVYRPEADGAFPVIMSAHPYGKDNIPARTGGPNAQYRAFPQPDRVRLSEWTSWEAPDPAVWCPLGYVVVNCDLRGGGTSEGVGDLLSDQEALDYFDLIAWAGTQPWSNGRVGLDGVSYLAISQYKVAALKPPHLAAICPWEGLSDLYRDFARPGGAREDGFSVVWSLGTRTAARIEGDLRAEIFARPERDAWYVSKTPEIEKIEVPMLVCGSFSDHSLHTRGSFEVFRRAGTAQKWLYTHREGKWSAYYGQDATQTRIAFFDHFLKGVQNGWDRLPAARIAVHDGGPQPIAVTREDAWPPRDLEWRALWLDAAAMSLSGAEAPTEPASVKFSTRGVAASFVWKAPADVDVIGPMALRLWVEVEGGGDAILFVSARKFRAGQELTLEGSFGFPADRVSKGWRRIAHRELDVALSTEMQPVHTHASAEPARAGEIVQVDVAMLPHATRFLSGDELRLEIAGAWPFARDPLQGAFPAYYQRSPPATCILHTGPARAARLWLGARPIAVTDGKRI